MLIRPEAMVGDWYAERGELCLLLEPFVGNFTSFLVAGILKEFGHDRSVCVHRGSDANRHGGYRFHGSTHARSRAGKDFLWTAASHSFAATCLGFSTLKMSSLARWGRPYCCFAN